MGLPKKVETWIAVIQATRVEMCRFAPQQTNSTAPTQAFVTACLTDFSRGAGYGRNACVRFGALRREPFLASEPGARLPSYQ